MLRLGGDNRPKSPVGDGDWRGAGTGPLRVRVAGVDRLQKDRPLPPPSFPAPSRVLPGEAKATGPRHSELPPPPLAQPPPAGPRGRRAGVLASMRPSPLPSCPQTRNPGGGLWVPGARATPSRTNFQQSARRSRETRAFPGAGPPYPTGSEEARRGRQEKQRGRQRRMRHPARLPARSASQGSRRPARPLNPESRSPRRPRSPRPGPPQRPAPARDCARKPPARVPGKVGCSSRALVPNPGGQGPPLQNPVWALVPLGLGALQNAIAAPEDPSGIPVDGAFPDKPPFQTRQ